MRCSDGSGSAQARGLAPIVAEKTKHSEELAEALDYLLHTRYRYCDTQLQIQISARSQIEKHVRKLTHKMETLLGP